MLRVLICDDEAIMIDMMRSIVENILSEKGIKSKIYAFSDARQISNPILASSDIALLDVDFENTSYNGMDIARRLRSLRKDAIIIFVTNFIEYAPAGYEVQAFRYVLKKNLHSELKSYFLLALDHLNKETLKIQINGEIIDIPLDNILYLEVQQHSVTVVTKTNSKDSVGKRYDFHASLTELEQRLEPAGFLRIHKSYLVNMKHLKRFQCREALMDDGTILRVGEKSYAEKKKVYLLWKGWQ